MDNRAVLKQRLDEVTADLAAGRRAQAHEAAKRLVAAFPDAAHAHNLYGIVRAAANDSKGAVASFQAAATLDPNFAEVHYNLGLVLCQQERFAAAAESLRRAIELDPRSAASYVILGNAFRQLGNFEEAVAAYEQGLKIGGVSEALIRNNLGAALLDLDLPEKACASFRRATALQPGFGEAHLNLGKALLRLGNIAEALESFGTASKLDPSSADSALLYGNSLRDLGKFEDSVVTYRQALQLRPDDKQALYHLGLSLLELGRCAEGMKAIADGPGVARISSDSRSPDKPRKPMTRIDVAKNDTPTFIGGWLLPNPEICDRLIAVFERNSGRYAAGRIGAGIDKAAKDSTDLTVLPCELRRPGFEAVAEYLAQLERCYQDYVAQWPFLRGVLPVGEIMPFTIQHYATGGHFQGVHSERTSSGFAHRVLAWMTYLDDVEEGGETWFHHFGIKVRPERGKTLIWPAEWTHAHSGSVVVRGAKHIITGWIHFPSSTKQPADLAR